MLPKPQALDLLTTAVEAHGDLLVVLAEGVGIGETEDSHVGMRLARGPQRRSWVTCDGHPLGN